MMSKNSKSSNRLTIRSFTQQVSQRQILNQTELQTAFIQLKRRDFGLFEEIS